MEIAILLLLVAGTIVVVWIIKLLGKNSRQRPPTQMPQASTPTLSQTPQQMIKRCPQCQSTYTDLTLRFCLSDGAPLETDGDNEFETVVRR